MLHLGCKAKTDAGSTLSRGTTYMVTQAPHTGNEFDTGYQVNSTGRPGSVSGYLRAWYKSVS